MSEETTCSICSQPIGVQPSGWAYGNNAQPVNDGRCCDHCNATVVVPERLGLLYPEVPGHSGDDTSKEAAVDMQSSVPPLRNRVLRYLRGRYMTVHECAEAMGASIPSIQPRFSELRRLGEIEDSGNRKTNRLTGKRAIVWKPR